MEQQNANTSAEQSASTTDEQLQSNINAQTPNINTNNTTSPANTTNAEAEEATNNNLNNNNNNEEHEENDDKNNEENHDENINTNSNSPTANTSANMPFLAQGQNIFNPNNTPLTNHINQNNQIEQSMLGGAATNSNLFNTSIENGLPLTNGTTQAFQAPNVTNSAPATPKTNTGLDSSFNFTQCYKDCSQSHDYNKLDDAFKKLCKTYGSYKGIMQDFSGFQAICQQHGLNVKKDGDKIVATFQDLPEKDPSKMTLNKDNEIALNLYQEKDQYIKSDNKEGAERNTEEEETEEEEEKSNNTGVIIAIIVILLAITVIGILTYLLLKKQEEKHNDIDNTPPPEIKKDPPTITGTPNTQGPESNEATTTGNSSTLNTTVHMEVPENSTLSSQELANIKQAAQIEMNPNVLTTVNGETYSGFRIDNGNAYGYDKYGQQHNLGNYENITAFYGIEHKPISNEVMTCMNNYKQQANGNGGWDYVLA